MTPIPSLRANTAIGIAMAVYAIIIIIHIEDATADTMHQDIMAPMSRDLIQDACDDTVIIIVTAVCATLTFINTTDGMAATTDVDSTPNNRLAGTFTRKPRTLCYGVFCIK